MFVTDHKDAAMFRRSQMKYVPGTVAWLKVIVSLHSTASCRRRIAISLVKAAWPSVLIASSIAWDALYPLSFIDFRIIADSSLTVMEYWFAMMMLNNNVI